MMFSDRITRLRKEKGLNQKELAERLSVSVDSVRRWEQGKRSPDVEILCKLARTLDTTVSYITGETDDPMPNSESIHISGDDIAHYTQEQIMNGGMIVYELGNGKRIVLPPSSESYKFLEGIALSMPQAAVTA